MKGDHYTQHCRLQIEHVHCHAMLWLQPEEVRLPVTHLVTHGPRHFCCLMLKHALL